jgi:hypothetical protein
MSVFVKIADKSRWCSAALEFADERVVPGMTVEIDPNSMKVFKDEQNKKYRSYSLVGDSLVWLHEVEGFAVSRLCEHVLEIGD